MLLTVILIIIISIPSTHRSFTPGLNLPFLQILLTAAFLFFFRTDSMVFPGPGLFTDTSEHTVFYFLVFLSFPFLVVGSVR